MNIEEITTLEQIKDTSELFVKMVTKIQDKYYLENDSMFNKFDTVWIHLSRVSLAIKNILEEVKIDDNTDRRN